MNDVSVAATPQVTPVRFAGRPGFLRLLIKNALLSIVMLGFYRFWARTGVRRALWNNVVIGGEPLEYTGRGIKLFIGFLIAMAIIAPMAAIYGAIQYLMLVSPVWAGVAQLIYFAVIGVLVQIAIFRARRYRLSRTQWRGIRCWQDGSSWRYVGISLLYGLLTLVTLGLAMPWLNTALQRYKIDHTIFGNRRFNFTGTGLGLLPKWLIVYGVAGVPLLIFVLMNASVLFEFLALAGEGDLEGADEYLKDLFREFRGLWLLPFIYVGGGIAWLWYRIAEFRYFVSRTHFGDAGMISDARLGRIVLIFLGYIATIFGLLIVVTGVAVLISIATSAAVYAGGWDPKAFISSPWFAAELIFIVAAFLLANYILAQYFMTYRIARHIVSTMTIANLAAVESVLQSPEMKPRFGEGLADAFDLGAV